MRNEELGGMTERVERAGRYLSFLTLLPNFLVAGSTFR
jgi:hypothetical protein